jgi:hypothetical protein
MMITGGVFSMMLSSEDGDSDSTITMPRNHHHPMDLSLGNIHMEGPGKG